MDSSGFEGMMNILVDISSHLLANKEGMQEMRVVRAATHIMSPSTTHADSRRIRIRVCHQLTPRSQSSLRL